MAKDKYTALWVSHSSMSDFLRCPRLYYLRNVYKDPKTNHKITVMTPHLALGAAVHDVIEQISVLPTGDRLAIKLAKRLETVWEKYSGEMGGFDSKEQEEDFKVRAIRMLDRVEVHPGPISKKAVNMADELPYYFLDEEENIILAGKVDWLEYVDKDDSVRVVDFKTGKNEEPDESLQLPIYYLLVKNTQGRKVSGVSYWYLDMDDKPKAQKLPDEEASREKILEVARRMKLGRQINRLVCPKGGCYACRDLERVVKGEGEFIRTSKYNQDIYILPS